MPWSDGVQPNFGYYTFHQTRQARLEHNEKVKTCEETMFTPPPSFIDVLKIEIHRKHTDTDEKANQ